MPAEPPVIDHPREVAQHARVLRAIVIENFPGTLGHNRLRFTIRLFVSPRYRARERALTSISIAQRAAPVSAAAGLSETRTGILASTLSSRPLARKARTNPPAVSVGRIFGAIPPPRVNATQRHKLQRQVGRLRAVNIDEHSQRLDASRVAALERGLAYHRRRIVVAAQIRR